MANGVKDQKLEFMLAKEYKENMKIPREFKDKEYLEDKLISTTQLVLM